mgnify:FL=1
MHLQKSTASDETEFVAVIYDATQMINARAQSRLTFENVAQCLLEIGRELNSRQPLDARMTKVCEVTVRLLSCDRCSIFLLDDGYYRAKWNFGNPPDIQERFPEFKVSTEDPLVTKAVQAKHYVLVNDPIRDSLMNTETAIAARIRSLCVVPILGLGEDALGFMTAEFNERDGPCETGEKDHHRRTHLR